MTTLSITYEYRPQVNLETPFPRETWGFPAAVIGRCTCLKLDRIFHSTPPHSARYIIANYAFLLVSSAHPIGCKEIS